MSAGLLERKLDVAECVKAAALFPALMPVLQAVIWDLVELFQFKQKMEHKDKVLLKDVPEATKLKKSNE